LGGVGAIGLAGGDHGALRGQLGADVQDIGARPVMALAARVWLGRIVRGGWRRRCGIIAHCDGRRG
jgi:hypothetical protein